VATVAVGAAPVLIFPGPLLRGFGDPEAMAPLLPHDVIYRPSLR